MDATLLHAARGAIGFMPEDEGLALYEAGIVSTAGPWLEIGSYCGKSTIYLGAAAREKETVLYSLDHHRGSEEHQRGQEYFDERLVDPATGAVDSLPKFRATIEEAGLTDVVIPVIGSSEIVAPHWSTPLGLVFIDGSHSEAACSADYEGWAPHIVLGGLLIIHDVFTDPSAGGQAPRQIYERALASSAFTETSATKTLRVLKRIDEGL